MNFLLFCFSFPQANPVHPFSSGAHPRWLLLPSVIPLVKPQKNVLLHVFLCRRLTLYIPSAVELTRGGFFYPRGDGTYDTIISAQHILKSFADSHEKQLAGLKLLLPDSTELLQSPAAAAAVGGAAGGAVSEQRDSLRDLVNTGLSTDDNVSRWMRQKGTEG
jgi:hypothetical protein